MKKEIILTPEELYYMGALLRAKYIDYAYVAAMSDISQNREIYESTSRDGLAGKEVLMEDFSGNLEVNAEAKNLLEPVFFGELESAVNIACLEAEGDRKLYNRRFHFYEGRITATVMGPEGILLQAVDDGQLQTWIAGLLPEGYQADTETIPAGEIDRKQISRIIAVKSNQVGKRSAVEIYVEYNGKIYQEKQRGKASVLSAKDFCLEVYRGVRGGTDHGIS